jgi:hypothetical protein
VLHPNVKFAILKEQVLFYGDITDDDPIDYHDVDVEKESPEELAGAIEGLITSAEQAGNDPGWCSEFTTVVNRVKRRCQAQAWRRPSCEGAAACHQAARRWRTRANVTSKVRSTAAEGHA